MTTFRDFAAKAMIAVVLVGLSFVVLDYVLLVSEVEDCDRLTSQAEAGYPVTVPDWCADVYARAEVPR